MKTATKTITFHGIRITLEKLLDHEYLEDKQKETDIQAIIASVVEDFGVTFLEIRSRKRPYSICRARHALYLKLRAYGLSYSEIGRICGRTHHSIRFYLTERKPQ